MHHLLVLKRNVVIYSRKVAGIELTQLNSIASDNCFLKKTQVMLKCYTLFCTQTYN